MVINIYENKSKKKINRCITFTMLIAILSLMVATLGVFAAFKLFP